MWDLNKLHECREEPMFAEYCISYHISMGQFFITSKFLWRFWVHSWKKKNATWCWHRARPWIFRCDKHRQTDGPKWKQNRLSDRQCNLCKLHRWAQIWCIQPSCTLSCPCVEQCLWIRWTLFVSCLFFIFSDFALHALMALRKANDPIVNILISIRDW